MRATFALAKPRPAGAEPLWHALMERHAGDRTITVSTQVLQETYSVLVRKRYLDPAQALRVAREPVGKRATKR